MENLDVTVLRAVHDWREKGQSAVLATVVHTWGSSPRPVGCIMAMRQDGGGWAPVRSKGQLMYPDMDLLTMLSLTAHVLKDNLTTFFRALPALQAPGQEPKTT